MAGRSSRSTRARRARSCRPRRARSATPSRGATLSSLIWTLNTRTFRSLRRHRNYRLFFAGQLVSVAGSWMQNTALAWLVLEISGSPLAVGALAFCRFLPFTVLGLFAGVVVDRFDTRRIVMATQASAMAISVALAVVTLADVASLPLVYLLAALGGTALVFDASGRQALTFEMVGRKELQNALALNSGLFNASRVVGPAVAGVAIAVVGTGWCFAVNAVSFLAVLAALALMQKSELVAVQPTPPGTGVLGDVREALGYVARDVELRAVLGVVAVVSLVGFNFHVLVPLLATKLDVGSAMFGLLSAAFGAGALAGALAMATMQRASRRAFVAGTTGFSLLLLALAPVSSPAVAAVVLAALGVCFTLLTANANALVQLGAPDHLRGRLISLYLLAFAGLAPFGGLLAGWLAHTAGTGFALAAGGAVGLVAVAVASRSWRPGVP